MTTAHKGVHDGHNNLWGSAARSMTLPVGGHFVEKDVLDLAEEVAARFPNLRIASCDCNRCAERGHFPHVVVEMTRDGQQRPVLGFYEFGRHVIDMIHKAHISNLSLRDLEDKEGRARQAKKKEAREELEANLEVVEAALKSPKIEWTGPNGVKTDPHAKPFASRRVAKRVGRRRKG